MTYTLHMGDCLDVLRELPADSVDTILTDPPYGLAFMGKAWDHGVPGAPFWAEALRVAKPGAMLLAFGGTRTYHRLACAIEDAGWEVRDCLMWLYGSGFPKSHDISKAIDKAAGAERERIPGPPSGGMAALNLGNAGHGYRDSAYYEHGNMMLSTAPATEQAALWNGWGTALKPAWEPIILAMKPLDGTFAQNALKHGVAGLNIDGARIDGAPWKAHRATGLADTKFFTDGACKVIDKEPHTAGRWPANLLLDEDAAALLDAQSGELTSGKPNGAKRNANGLFLAHANGVPLTGFGDTGGASRFFYVAKASRREREAGLEGMAPSFMVAMNDGIGAREHNPEQPTAWVRNHHPTVKPLRLMEYLCRLTATPTGGVVLDPFMGSGTTGVACIRTGRNFIGIEKEAGYMDIARKRIEDATAQLPLLEVP